MTTDTPWHQMDNAARRTVAVNPMDATDAARPPLQDAEHEEACQCKQCILKRAFATAQAPKVKPKPFTGTTHKHWSEPGVLHKLPS